jgi:hypothetical protein
MKTMATRLAPIHTKGCKALGWQITAKKSSIESLRELLSSLETLISSLKSGTLPAKKHLEAKAKLKEALKECGQTIPGVAALKSALTEGWAEKKAKALEKKTEATLIREVLKLSQNEPKLRSKSQTYEEAWPEVEAHYFAKISLYKAELAKRSAKV